MYNLIITIINATPTSDLATDFAANPIYMVDYHLELFLDLHVLISFALPH
jgi:hypothetical protein